MEFRGYAAFGYVTKVVSNGRVNAKLHATSRNLVAALPRCAVSQNFILPHVQIHNGLRITAALANAKECNSELRLKFHHI